MRLLWILLLLLPGAAWPQDPPQGGEIHGRVTDRETGKPVSRAGVMLGRMGANEPTRTTTTDDDGGYRFTNLPAGSYSGMVDAAATRGTYAVTSLSIGSGPTAYRLALKAGEIREVNVALTRTYAIPVRVVDEWGEPLSNLRVMATPTKPGGRSMQSFLHETDDHGRLRIFGLDPGRYIVCVPIEGPTSSRQAKGFSGDTILTTCYPSASELEAEVVQVDRADVGELEIRMRRGRTFTVSGNVVDASGVPAGDARIGITKFITGGSTSWGIRIDASGRFTANVTPGEYAIEASVGGTERPEQRRSFEGAFLPISVSGNMDGLVLQLQRGLEIPGRILVEPLGTPLPPPPGSGLMIHARLVDDLASGFGSTRSVLVRKDYTFTLDRVFGRRRLSVLNVPRGWYVKMIRYDGKEVTDDAVEFKDVKNPPVLDVVLANQGATLAGRAVDDSGNPVARAMVLMFRADSAQSDRAEAYVVASSTGTFRLGPFRQGTYALVAIPAGSDAIQMGQWERVARLVTGAERITIGEREERTAEVRVQREVSR